jgi:hypothetical protein
MKLRITLMISAFICLLGLSHPAFAEKEVFAPAAEQGEWELESTGVYDIDPHKDKNAVQEYHYSVGYGVNSFWHTELEVEAETEPTDNAITPFRATHMEWENILQLAPKGEFWLDPGVYLAYEAPLIHGEVGQFEGKILLEKSIGKFTNILNISFNQEVGGGADPDTDAGVSWSTRYRLSQYFEPGVEYWDDFSKIAHQLDYDQQSHQVGPVFYGHLLGHLNYDLGYLFGISDAAPRGELKWVLEYEF